jgi:hypothetical protein
MNQCLTEKLILTNGNECKWNEMNVNEWTIQSMNQCLPEGLTSINGDEWKIEKKNWMKEDGGMKIKEFKWMKIKDWKMREGINQSLSCGKAYIRHWEWISMNFNEWKWRKMKNCSLWRAIIILWKD